MANKNIYKNLLAVLVLLLLGVMFIVIEATMFFVSIIGGIIGNSIVALLLFLMYMSNKKDVNVVSGEEVDNEE